MENSPEYRTIIELTPELTNAFKSDLISLSGEFLSAGFINNGNAGNLRNQHNDAEGRAADLVSWITDKIQLEPKGNYRAFIDVLKRRLADHKSILGRLDEKYKELSKLIILYYMNCQLYKGGRSGMAGVAFAIPFFSWIGNAIPHTPTFLKILKSIR